MINVESKEESAKTLQALYRICGQRVGRFCCTTAETTHMLRAVSHTKKTYRENVWVLFHTEAGPIEAATNSTVSIGFVPKQKSSTEWRPRERKFVVAQLKCSFRLRVLLVIKFTVQLRFRHRDLLLPLRPKAMVMQVTMVPICLDECFRNALVWWSSRKGARTAYTDQTLYICHINTDVAKYRTVRLAVHATRILLL